MSEITEDIEAVVEDTELPKRLKDDVYDAIEEREDVDVEEADRIAKAVESRYRETRIDALDPVGTVSAQSIGEPGTQMSIPADERILLRRNGETEVTEIGGLVDDMMASREARAFDEHEVSLAPDDLAVLSLGHDEQLRWKSVQEVSRHETPEELLRFELESGRTIRATKAHSFVTHVDGDIRPVRGDSLDVGDHLPVAGTYHPDAGEAEFSGLSQPLTDGGVATGTVDTEVAPAVGEADWDRIESIETVTSDHEYVYDVSVAGLETFTTAEGVVTHNTMNTFHYAGVAEIDVTQGLPRLIELVDARKTPDTPMMTVNLEGEYATDREKAHEVVWKIEATRILALGDVSTNVADMVVGIDLNEETLAERWPSAESIDEVVEDEIADRIDSELDEIDEVVRTDETRIQFEPEQPSYRDLLQLVEELRDVVFKGIDEVSRVVVRKEEVTDEARREELGQDEQFVLYTEGSAFGDVLGIDGVDASRTTCNNIHEIHEELGIEAAREAIIEETMNTLEEQGLDDVNVRHLMLVADIMTNRGEIESIGRHGISGSKESVLARAAFEVTVNHLLDAAVHGEIDDLDGVTENVIVGKPIKLGTGDVELRMGAGTRGGSEESGAD